MEVGRFFAGGVIFIIIIIIDVVVKSSSAFVVFNESKVLDTSLTQRRRGGRVCVGVGGIGGGGSPVFGATVIVRLADRLLAPVHFFSV